MIAIPIDKVENVISELNAKLSQHIIQIERELKSLLFEPIKDVTKTYGKRELSKLSKDINYFTTVQKSVDQVTYVKHLFDNLESIVLAKPDVLAIFKKEFDDIIDKDKIAVEFKDILIEKMDYSKLRGIFYPEYFSGIGIKSCVYCNSQLAVVSNKSSAHFEVDHNLSKSKYPCFSISLFNLYPICGSCNKRKSKNDIDFKLYSVDTVAYTTSNFSFELDKISLAKYLTNNDITLLKIKFKDKQSLGFDKTFKIEGIYNTQKDLAEELIEKVKIYNNAYKKSLVTSFGRLYTKSGLGNRLLIGNYCEENQIHNRPMSKFTQDVARQLKLI